MDAESVPICGNATGAVGGGTAIILALGIGSTVESIPIVGEVVVIVTALIITVIALVLLVGI